MCIACGIATKAYHKRKMPRVRGREMVPCWGCRRAVPVWEGWLGVMMTAYPYLTRGLGRGAEADRERLEVGMVGYCRQCLERRLGFGVDGL